MFTKLVRFFIILALIIAGGWYLLYRNQNLLPKEKLSPTIKSLLALHDNDSLGLVLGQATENLDTKNLNIDPNTLSVAIKRSQQILNQARQLINGFIQVDETKGKNPTDRVIKYATYVYCKQVIDEWEKNSP